MDFREKPLVILTGPTAVGKTAASIKLAKAINGAIISADSMQIYKYMDIGSAKITPEEMQGVKHYLVDELLPSEEFHIVRFQEMANKALEEIYAKGQIPIVVGGTGFYIQALLYQIDFQKQDADYEFRKQMESYLLKNGAHALHEMLKEIDPVSYESIHENNTKRVIRALEFYHLTGKPISKHNEEEANKKSPFRFAYFVLNDDREHLYERIDKRVDIMLEQGLFAEVEKLKEMGYTRDMVSMQGIGYKEVLDALNQKISNDEAIYLIKRESRHFAKRQITWFKRERDVIWLDKSAFQYNDDLLLEEMISILNQKGIIHG